VYSGGGTVTNVITPSAIVCAGSGSAGSSGGGGMVVGSGPLAPSAAGVSGYTPPRPQIDYPDGTGVYLGATTTASTSTKPAAPGASHVSITHNHRLGDHSTDILALQQFLNTHGFTVATTGPGSPGRETNLFGAKTFQALKKFQQAHSLPATGYLGPLTRALINTLSITATTSS
jgi:Putative peptidoglycan binding domain